MRVLTVRQPWAWAIIHGGKTVENRARNIAGDYRGPVAIHVALREDVNAFSDLNSPSMPALDAAADAWLNELTPKEAARAHSTPWHMNHGRLIGVVDLVDAHHTGPFEGECWHDDNTVTDWCSPWSEMGAHHLVLANPRALDVPIPWKGALGLRNAPFEVVGDWLAEHVNTCTCGTGKLSYQHEPYCGLEQAARLVPSGPIREQVK